MFCFYWFKMIFSQFSKWSGLNPRRKIYLGWAGFGAQDSRPLNFKLLPASLQARVKYHPNCSRSRSRTPLSGARSRSRSRIQNGTTKASHPWFPPHFSFQLFFFLCKNISPGAKNRRRLNRDGTFQHRRRNGRAGGNGPLTFWPKMSTKKFVLTYVKEKKMKTIIHLPYC